MHREGRLYPAAASRIRAASRPGKTPRNICADILANSLEVPSGAVRNVPARGKRRAGHRVVRQRSVASKRHEKEVVMMTVTIEQQVLELEHAYWQAIRDRDVEAVLRLTADPCMVTGASGVMQLAHATYAQMMGGETTWQLHDFSIEDVQFVQVTDDVVTLAYRVREEMTVEGERLTLKAADASVWTSTAGQWRCVLHTESVLGDSFGRDRKS
jgi:hypothetical protein